MATAIKGLTYVTKDGDMVDAIAYKTYGYSYGSLEVIFAANRHIKMLPEELPAGVTLFLPDIPRGIEQKTINIWD